MPQDEKRCECSVWTMCCNSCLTRPASIFNCPSSLVTISEDLSIIILCDVKKVVPACNIPIVPDCSCLDKYCGMINQVIELELQCFLYMYNYELHVKW